MSTADTVLRSSDQSDRHLRTDDLLQDLGRRTARGGVVTLFSQSAKFLLSMVATVVLARLLTPADYGLVGMVGVITGFIAIFKDLGLAAATIQKAEITNEQVSTLFWLNVAVSAGIMVFTAIISPVVAWFYGEPRLTTITLAYAFGFLLGGVAVQHEALLRRRMRFTALAIAEISSLIISIVVAIVLARAGLRYWALIGSQLTLGLCYAIAVWVACGWKPGLPVRNAGTKSLVVFGGNLTGFGVVNYFSRNLDNALIGKFWGPEQLGLYARAYQLLLVPIEQINGPITAVAVPALSRLKDSPDRYRQAYLRLLEKVALLTMPAMAFLIASCDWIVQIMLGPKWAGVSPIFALLGVAGLFQPVAGTTGWLFVTQDRTNDMFRWGILGGVIIILSIVAGLKWGSIGVAASYSGVYVVVIVPLLFWFVSRKGPIRAGDFYRTIIPVLLACICSLVVAVLFRKWMVNIRPFYGILSIGLIFSLITLLSLLVIPNGRAILDDSVRSLSLLRGGNANAKQ